MTDFDKAVKRRTLHAYRMALTGAMQSASGRRLVVEMHGDQAGDWLTIRESGRRRRVTLDVAELYRKGLIAQARQGKGKRGRK